MSKLGFIGLGIMGVPMAGHLIAAGHEVFLNTLNQVPRSLVDAGGKACPSAAAVAKAADIIFIMVPDTPQVEEVLFGDDGVAEALSDGKTVVDMSSISPLATKEFATKINELGCEYIDAPVSGGEVGAKAANLTIMCGGSPKAFARVKPLFELMGKNITLVGGNGDGQTCKVANQIIVALTIEAVGEALLFASKAGKDLNLALSNAREMGVSLPNTATAQELFNACAAHGGKAWDHSAMVKALELLAGHEVA